MKVLLTGSAGFIGSAIGAALEAEGYDVVRVDLMLATAHGDARPPAGTHHLDVRDAAHDRAWSGVLDGVGLVCHQAAVVGAGTSVADLPLYAGHNDLGTAALFAAMTEHGIRRLVLASSMVVYGEGRYRCAAHGDRTPPIRSVEALQSGDFAVYCDLCGESLSWGLVDETARLDPRSSYAASKVAQEHYAAAWARQADATAIALRYHNVYGPGMPADTPYSGVAAIFRSSLERGEPPQVFEDGGQVRDFVHVDDVARANLAALQATAEAEGGRLATYNVASGVPVTIGRVAELVAAGAGRAVQPAVTGRFRLGDVRHVVASPARAEHDLGFRARIGPEVGLPAFATAPLRPAAGHQVV